MISYINGAGANGKDKFGGRLPSIFEIQECIERAWDMGINAQGRIETGGIKGTRKYIGTPEVSQYPLPNQVTRTERVFTSQAQALLVSLSIP